MPPPLPEAPADRVVAELADRLREALVENSILRVHLASFSEELTRRRAADTEESPLDGTHDTAPGT